MAKEHIDRDYSLGPVAPQDKRGLWSMLVILCGFTFYTGTMLTGGRLGTSLTFDALITALLIGDAVLGIYTAALAYISAKTSLSTHLLARYSFGKVGSFFVSGILGLTQVGWFGVSVVMLALPVCRVFGLPEWPAIVVLGLMMVASAYYGIKSLAILSFIAVPAIAILGCYSTGISLSQVGGFAGLESMTELNTISMTAAVGMVIGSFISGGTLTPDFARFSKTPSIAVTATVAAFFAGNILMFAFGAIGGLCTGLPDISDVMIAQGLIIPGIVILGLNIWTTNDNTIYAASLAFSNITGIEKRKMVIINGVIAIALSVVLYNHFISFLGFLSGFIPALGAIIITDFFLVHRSLYKKDYKSLDFVTVNPIAFIAFALSQAASAVLPGIACFNAVLAASVSYAAIYGVLRALKHMPAAVRYN